MRAEAMTALHRKDATAPGPNPSAPFEVIFLDPPYGKAMGEAALNAALAGGWIAPGALIIWEEGAAPTLPEGFTLEDQRKYGDTLVTIARAP